MNYLALPCAQEVLDRFCVDPLPSHICCTTLMASLLSVTHHLLATPNSSKAFCGAEAHVYARFALRLLTYSHEGLERLVDKHGVPCSCCLPFITHGSLIPNTDAPRSLRSVVRFAALCLPQVLHQIERGNMARLPTRRTIRSTGGILVSFDALDDSDFTSAIEASVSWLTYRPDNTGDRVLAGIAIMIELAPVRSIYCLIRLRQEARTAFLREISEGLRGLGGLRVSSQSIREVEARLRKGINTTRLLSSIARYTHEQERWQIYADMTFSDMQDCYEAFSRLRHIISDPTHRPVIETLMISVQELRLLELPRILDELYRFWWEGIVHVEQRGAIMALSATQRGVFDVGWFHFPWNLAWTMLKTVEDRQLCMALGCSRSRDTEGRSLRFCGTCRRIPFCSRSCQRTAWRAFEFSHKQACESIIALTSGARDCRRLHKMEIPGAPSGDAWWVHAGAVIGYLRHISALTSC
jgi:hypothetical protein